MSEKDKKETSAGRGRPTLLKLALRAGTEAKHKINSFLLKTSSQIQRKRKIQEPLIVEKYTKRVNTLAINDTSVLNSNMSKPVESELTTIDIRNQLMEYMDEGFNRTIGILTKRMDDDQVVFQQQISDLQKELTETNKRLSALEKRPINTIDPSIQRRLDHIESIVNLNTSDVHMKSLQQQLNKETRMINMQERLNRE